MNKPATTFLFIVICFAASAQYKKYGFQQPKMGSPFNIIIYSLDSAKAENAALAAFRMIDTLNEIYSDYLPNSELNRLCATSGTGKWVKVSEPLFTILKKAYRAGIISLGSFDVTMSPVIRLWRTARKEKKLPDKDSLMAAKQRVSYKYIELNTDDRSIRLQKAGMQLDLGGIAKGETAQRAYTRLCELGFPYSLLDAGGDIVAGDVPPQVEGWKVAINLPETEELMNQQLLLRNKAVTTSGDLYQYLELNGVRYSHIIDPATGWALTNSRNVTVIADNGADADWLTKACSILPIKKALNLIEKMPSTEVQIAILENNKPRFYRSPGFLSYFKQAKDVK
ncbi:MAG TPA: FAD:protein FMN transferase [Segetibacter sp.]|nr:FAD:protein FMN transferase [Segetibacter sp.]